jgi:hypothetical protein
MRGVGVNILAFSGALGHMSLIVTGAWTFDGSAGAQYW